MTEQQKQAVELVARGFTYKEIGKRLDVSERTVRRWMATPEAKEALARARQAEPSVLSILRAALSATTAQGHPDWRARLQAARLLLLPGVEELEREVEGTRVTIIELSAEEGSP